MLAVATHTPYHRTRLMLLALLTLSANACTTTRFVRTPRGAVMYDVRFVNDCARGTANVYFDGEYRQRRRLDVRPRRIGHGESKVLSLPAGRHTYTAEVTPFSGDGQLVTGELVVDRDGTLRLCTQ
jgi:hypothetical protein